MRIARLACFALLFMAAPAAPAGAETAATRGTVTAFVDVNVLPMDAERVLPHRTVLVRDGRIDAVGEALAVPPGAHVVDGGGRAWLTPGLSDMHTHANSAEEMKVYLANGVTSVLHMGEASNAFMGQVRPAIHEGRRPGPHVYAAFVVDGSPRYGHFAVTNADEARWIVRLAKRNGYEFIKVYNDLSPEAFAALIEEGRAQGLPVVGHGVTRVGLRRQLDAGQLMVAHLEEFLYAFFVDPGQDPGDAAPDVQRIPAAIELLGRDRAFVTADLATYAAIARQWGKPEVVAGFLRQPEVRYLAPERRLEWAGSGYAGRRGSLDARLDFLRRFAKALADAGVPLLAGTDAPTIPGVASGFSLHEDLRALEQAGLGRYRALATATRTPGEFIHRAMPDAERFGTITPGQRADLLLLDANPLDDLDALRKPLGVMANGHWYTRKDLQGLLDEIAKRYESASPAH
ncbi:amidohydrolase [Dokdonella sp.]|uniref:amidohydrolase family protein n=1 Tax=Dokdonella sp. TaxID=2291710 RepID=UPI001B0EAC6A|nr:amidohydrolase [Dokdonella sp.]MBO9663988.1 amidohydrolase [Dokdonella sp.]